MRRVTLAWIQMDYVVSLFWFDFARIQTLKNRHVWTKQLNSKLFNISKFFVPVFSLPYLLFNLVIVPVLKMNEGYLLFIVLQYIAHRAYSVTLHDRSCIVFPEDELCGFTVVLNGTRNEYRI